MRTTLVYFLLVAGATWAPFGLIHLGQRLENPRAGSIAAQLLTRCDPTTPEWQGCR